VVGRAIDHELVVWDAPRPERVPTGSPTVEMHVVDQLGAGPQRLFGHGIEVADDDVRLEPHLEERVGAAVDADQDGLVLADVGAQRGEVGAVVVAAHYDEGVPAADLRLDRRQLDRLERHLRLALEVLEGVHPETFELAADRDPGMVHGGLDLLGGERVAGRDQLVASLDLAAVYTELLALVHTVQHVLPGSVDERDARLHDADGAAVRVAAGDRFPGVDDGGHPGADEPLGGHAVEVAVVDHCDVAGLEALHEVLGSAVDAGGTRHGRGGTGATPGHGSWPV